MFRRNMLAALTEEPKALNDVEKLKFTAAGVTRLIEMGEQLYPHNNWASNKLYASGLGYTSVPEFVLQYFDHHALTRSISANAGMAMEAGTAVHNYLQSRLMLAGVLHPRIEGHVYKEQRFECEKYRIVSKVDGLVDEQQLAELGSKGFSGQAEARPLNLDLLEIKLLSTHKYQSIKTWQDISIEYRLQAVATQRISGYPRTIFMLVDRGSLSFRFIVYRGEDHLWQRITTMSTEIFAHLKDLTRPEGFKDEWLKGMTWEQWVNYHIERQPKRKWFHKENTEEETSEGGGFIIA